MVNIKSVGVIGAGQMGTGIAHVAALHGYDVLLNDLTREKIDAGLALIEHNMGRQVARGAITDKEMKAGKSSALVVVLPSDRAKVTAVS